ncbi:MAG: Rieske 2Fe-2S domain-containing protein [Planctomycetes bacterium]|nr:Rieske 2Fe-2S domain-containing protein [Planctomycetota bacterium]
MSEFERRNFLIWAAGSAFAFLTVGSSPARAALGALAEQDKGKKPGDPKDPKKGTESKPASKPADNSKSKDKEIAPGDQTDGSYVLDPDNPPKVDIKTKGTPGGNYVKLGNDTVFVAQSTDKKHWYAVSAICSHKACAVSFKNDEIVCPCHGSKFSTTGKVTKGPAKDDLAEFKTEEVKGKAGKKFVKISKK